MVASCPFVVTRAFCQDDARMLTTTRPRDGVNFGQFAQLGVVIKRSRRIYTARSKKRGEEIAQSAMISRT